MVEIREAVNDGYRSLFFQLLQRRVAVHSGQHDVTQPREDPARTAVKLGYPSAPPEKMSVASNERSFNIFML